MNVKVLSGLWVLAFLGCMAPEGMKTAVPVRLGASQTPQEIVADSLAAFKVEGLPSATDSVSGLKILNKVRVRWPGLSDTLSEGDLIVVEKFNAGSDSVLQSFPMDRTATEQIDLSIPPTLGLKYDYRLKVQMDGEEHLSKKIPFEIKVLPKPKNPDLVFQSNHIKMLALNGNIVVLSWGDRSDNESGFEYKPSLMCNFTGGGFMEVGIDVSGITPDQSQTFKHLSEEPAETGSVEVEDALTLPYLTQPGSNVNTYCTQKRIRYKIRAFNESGASDWVQTEDMDF